MSAPHRPRKRFGQHFLTSGSTVSRILEAIRPRPGDTIVEIGPGRGAITDGLSVSGASVHAVEFDRDLVPWLEERFRDRRNVTIHEADALRFDFGGIGRELRIVGNLPYNISTPLLFHLMKYTDSITDLHFMLQKEVVDRMAAEPGSKAYGRLTIMLGCRMHVEQLFEVPPEAFEPPPKVHSAFARLRPRPREDVPVEDLQLMSQVVAQAFSQRRKILRNALRGTATEQDLESVGISPASRAEEVPIASWMALANHLANQDRMGAPSTRPQP
jgi:16S rRNA (adenine1518-N6/adenine1519-N6)-dimethyltransferase